MTFTALLLCLIRLKKTSAVKEIENRYSLEVTFYMLLLRYLNVFRQNSTINPKTFIMHIKRHRNESRFQRECDMRYVSCLKHHQTEQNKQKLDFIKAQFIRFHREQIYRSVFHVNRIQK